MSVNIASPMNLWSPERVPQPPRDQPRKHRSPRSECSTELGSMTDRWFNANFGGHSNDDEGIDAAISKGNVQRSGFKC